LKGIGRDFRLAAVTWFREGVTVIQTLFVALGPVLPNSKVEKQSRIARQAVRSRVFTVPVGGAKYGS
jgi:hypothetical protein